MIEWEKINNFKKEEFSEDPEKYADPILIYCLDYLRTIANQKIFPSPVKGALARFGGSETSQHYVGKPNEEIIRKSTAIDVFMEGILISNFYTILNLRLFNGVGIYLDTTGTDGHPWCMLHLDIRKIGFNNFTPLLWVAEKIYSEIKNKDVWHYTYPQHTPEYWDLLQDPRLFKDKRFGVDM